MSGRIASAEVGGIGPVSAYGSEPPTGGPIKAAREHGLDSPGDATKDELSDLLSLDSWQDAQASPELQAIAQRYGVKVTRYSGKKMLFQRIFDHLTQPGHEHDLACWFTYRVYRELVGGATGSPVKGPTDPLIQTVARQLCTDPAFIESMRRYRGSDLVWFGRWTAPDGTTHEGGSNRTTAYRRAVELLRPFASGERRETSAKNAERRGERPVPRPYKITHWHIAGAVLAVLLWLLIIGH